MIGIQRRTRSYILAKNGAMHGLIYNTIGYGIGGWGDLGWFHAVVMFEKAGGRERELEREVL